MTDMDQTLPHNRLFVVELKWSGTLILCCIILCNAFSRCSGGMPCFSLVVCSTVVSKPNNPGCYSQQGVKRPKVIDFRRPVSDLGLSQNLSVYVPLDTSCSARA